METYGEVDVQIHVLLTSELDGGVPQVPYLRVKKPWYPLEKRLSGSQKLSERYRKLNSVALVRERTIPTERPPFVGEVSANFCGHAVSRGQRGGSLWS
jgi:hypothetical protein